MRFRCSSASRPVSPYVRHPYPCGRPGRGLGTSVVLGVGVAAAVDNTAASTAGAVQAQAAAQSKAAEKQAKAVQAQAEKAQKAAEAKKAAAAKAAQAKKAAKAAAKKKAASWIDPVKSYKLSASFAQNGGMWAHKHPVRTTRSRPAPR